MPAISDARYRVDCGWNDVPHLDEKTKRDLLASTLPYLREARSEGKPSMGAGAIYPLPQSEFVVPPRRIPSYWPRAYGLDVGWNRTAAIWGAMDEASDTLYLYTEHYLEKSMPAVHAAAINARGKWIPGVIDPASRAANQQDGKQLLEIYREWLDIDPADNGVTAGLEAVWDRLSTGRLKVFSSCRNWLAEHRVYQRDEKGNIVKKFDHLMDATRYLVMSGIKRMRTEPLPIVGAGAGGDLRAGY